MKRRRVVMILAGMVVAGVMVALVWPSEKEPEYGGKKLSEWLNRPLTAPVVGMQPSSECRHAVRQMGTNAIPVLLVWLQREPSPWRGRLTDVAFRLPFGADRMLGPAL